MTHGLLKSICKVISELARLPQTPKRALQLRSARAFDSR
jgi:hypothetical protein